MWLYLVDCGLTDEDVVQLLPAISKLEELDISHNKLSVQSYKLLANEIKEREYVSCIFVVI